MSKGSMGGPCDCALCRIRRAGALHEEEAALVNLDTLPKIYESIFPEAIRKKAKRFTFETPAEGYILGAGPTLRRAIETCVFDTIVVDNHPVIARAWKDAAQKNLLAEKLITFYLTYKEGGLGDCGKLHR